MIGMIPDHTHSHSDVHDVARRLRAALDSGQLDAFGALLADNVRWGGEEDTPDTCHSRADVLRRLQKMRGGGMETRVVDVVPGENSVLLELRISQPASDGSTRQRTVFQALTLRDGLVSDIRGFPSRTEAAERAGLMARSDRMHVDAVVPILNVSSLLGSFAWFEKLGWTRKWDWSSDGGEPTFGAVGCGDFEICLCRDGQGGRGDSGVWMAIWIDDVDAVYERCQQKDLQVLRPPEDESWGVREMHVRHPDGHVFRVSQPIHHHH